MKKIRLTSINKDSLIHPSELLFPVNGITNLVNLLENFEQINNDYLSRQNSKSKEQPFLEFLNDKLRINRSYIKTNQERNAVLMESMSKKSPYWIDLVLNVSPYVLDFLHLVIEAHENEMEDKLNSILSNFDWFNLKTPEEKRAIVRSIIRNIRFILGFVRISFKNEEE
jgi:hypothetical protein